MSTVKISPDALRDLDLPDLEAIRGSALPKRKLSRLIENYEMSADLKALLMTMSDTAIMIGKKLVPIGRAVLSAAVSLAKMFPALTMTVVLAKFLPILAGLGLMKVALAKTLAVILPLLGAYQDIKDAILNDTLSKASVEMSKLFSASSEV